MRKLVYVTAMPISTQIRIAANVRSITSTTLIAHIVRIVLRAMGMEVATQ